jgi:Flp pilus assembly pilin Flp
MLQLTLTWIFAKLHMDERGQDLIEYAMLGGLIALAILGVIGFLTGAIGSMADGIGRCIDFDSTSVCDPV